MPIIINTTESFSGTVSFRCSDNRILLSQWSRFRMKHSAEMNNMEKINVQPVTQNGNQGTGSCLKIVLPMPISLDYRKLQRSFNCVINNPRVSSVVYWQEKLAKSNEITAINQESIISSHPVDEMIGAVDPPSSASFNLDQLDTSSSPHDRQVGGMVATTALSFQGRRLDPCTALRFEVKCKRALSMHWQYHPGFYRTLAMLGIGHSMRFLLRGILWKIPKVDILYLFIRSSMRRVGYNLHKPIFAQVF
jgi:hypothetical protein